MTDDKSKMKCDDCVNMKFHPAGSWYAVAEGGDDPYPYWYCKKGHWCGDPEVTPPIEDNDPFKDCSDFQEDK